MIDELRGKKGLSDYERAQVWNITAYSYYLQENFPEAIRAYDTLLQIPDLPEDAYVLSDVLTDHFSKDKKVGISVVSAGPHPARRDDAEAERIRSMQEVEE